MHFVHYMYKYMHINKRMSFLYFAFLAHTYYDKSYLLICIDDCVYIQNIIIYRI